MERFWNKVKKTENCWNWIAGLRQGYGVIKYNGKVIDAHRLSWLLHFKKIPKGLLVCHRCDNRLCVNPEHLFLGTHSDNMKDAYNKGRIVLPAGHLFSKNHVAYNASITKSVAKKIRDKILNRGHKTLKALAKELKIEYQLIRDINCGRIYK